MALMYPDRINPDTKSDAEKRLYRAFREELDNTYVVFHSCHWLWLDDRRHPHEGEADFIIAHPERGILVMEVKGGRLHVDPRTGHWASTDRHGQSHPLDEDPFDQANRNRWVVLDYLKGKMGGPEHRINIGHAVAFPDIYLDQTLPGLDKPREIIMDMTDCADLSRWVGKALAYWRGRDTQRDTAPSELAVQVLMDLLAQPQELRPALWGSFISEQQQLIRLTEQQYHILSVLAGQRRALIYGCAGSGKTMLAAEKATRLARQGFRVLLTCFNKSLAAYLRQQLTPYPNLEILHFHGLCAELAHRANTYPEGEEVDDRFFDVHLPEALLAAVGKIDIRYDAVIVDEGQDFKETWWYPLQYLLHDPDEGILYIFFDDNQCLYVQTSSFPIQQPPYYLTVNCRNTQSIHNAVMQFYEAGNHSIERPTARGPRGLPVEIRYYAEAQDLLSSLAGVVHHLTEEQKVPMNEIAVLSPYRRLPTVTPSPTSDQAQPPITPGLPPLTSEWPPEQGKVYFNTIHSFKGLESPVVILVDLHRKTWNELKQLLYVGCSRARNYLIVLLPQSHDQKVSQTLTSVGAKTRALN